MVIKLLSKQRARKHKHHMGEQRGIEPLNLRTQHFVSPKIKRMKVITLSVLFLLFQGTLDYSSLAATSAALDFYGALGGQSGIAAYVEPMLDWAADMLAESLGTSRMKVPKSMEAPFMRLVGEWMIDGGQVISPAMYSLGRQLVPRFCKMFSESSPCLLGQHGSCSTAQRPVEL